MFSPVEYEPNSVPLNIIPLVLSDFKQWNTSSVLKKKKETNKKPQKNNQQTKAYRTCKNPTLFPLYTPCLWHV